MPFQIVTALAAAGTSASIAISSASNDALGYCTATFGSASITAAPASYFTLQLCGWDGYEEATLLMKLFPWGVSGYNVQSLGLYVVSQSPTGAVFTLGCGVTPAASEALTFGWEMTTRPR